MQFNSEPICSSRAIARDDTRASIASTVLLCAVWRLLDMPDNAIATPADALAGLRRRDRETAGAALLEPQLELLVLLYTWGIDPHGIGWPVWLATRTEDATFGDPPAPTKCEASE